MNEHIRRLLTKLQALVTRGVITRTDDTAATQTIQVELRFDEVADMIEHFQPFGLSFRPTADSEVIVLSVGASSDNLVAITATDRSIRPTGVEDGEGGLYTPSGWKVFCNADDTVCIGSKDSDQWLARADRVDAEIKAIRDAIINATPDAAQAGSGGLYSTMVSGLNTSPQMETKSDKTKGD